MDGVFSDRKRGRRLNKICYRCGVAFENGDEVHSQNGGRRHNRVFHKRCWEAMQI